MSSSPGNFSPALLALRRWGRRCLKAVSIGMMLLVVLLNVRLAKGVDVLTLSLKVRPIETTQIAVNPHNTAPHNINPRNIDPTAAANVSIFTTDNLTLDNPHGLSSPVLSVPITRYRLTRAQLLEPSSIETH